VTHCWKLGLVATLVLGGLLSSAGCGRGNPVATGVDRETRIRLNILATFYKEYLDSHRGKPPKDMDSLRQHLQTQADTIEAYKRRNLIGSLQELLTSARDDQPFVIMFGEKVGLSDMPGAFWIAHEQAGVDGKRMAVRLQGGVDVLDADQFARDFE